MKALISPTIVLLTLTVFAGCTHMGDVVKDVRFNKDGDLVIRKCDAIIYWNLYFVVWGDGDCREEVKPKPANRG